MSQSYFTLVFFLMVGHSLADYPLQGDFLATAKNRHTDLGAVFWPHAIFAHSMIHGGFVALITGSVWLGVAEVIVHGITDLLKCDNWIGLRFDQTIHILSKFVWALIALGAFS